MLLVYLEPLVITQIELLNSWAEQVNYWPRSYVHTDAYNAGIPVDYWLLFRQEMFALKWMLKYPDNTRIIRTLFDDPDPEIIR